MDEHMLLRFGVVHSLHHDIIDENHKGLSFWIDKHNRYADREVHDVIDGRLEATAAFLNGPARRSRHLKEHVYYRLPPFARAFALWMYRYFLRAGFLDGIPG